MNRMPPTVLICRLTDPAIRSERYRAVLSADERAHADGLRRPEVRARYVIARALVRLELARRLDCAPQAIGFSVHGAGKPCTERDCGWHFNLSHSRDCVVLALTRAGAVGVDVESRARAARIDALARHHYAPAEQRELADLPEPERRYRFFRLWTLKEACTKALGRDLWSTLSGIRLESADDPHLVLEGGAACPDTAAFWHFPLDDSYHLALVCLTAADEPMVPAPRLMQLVPGETPQPLALEPDLAGVRSAP